LCASPSLRPPPHYPSAVSSLREESYGPGQQTVYFETNDPERPHHTFSLSYNLRGGLTVVPAQLDFGKLPPGADGTGTANVYTADPAFVPQFSRVEVSDPVFRFESFEPPTKGVVAPGKDTVSREFVSRLVFRYRGSVEERVSTAIATVFDKDGKPVLKFPLLAETCHPIKVYPTTLTLPKKTDSGLSFEGKLVVRSIDNSSFTISKIISPPGVTAAAVPGHSPAPVQLLTVALGRDAAPSATLDLAVEVEHEGTRLIVHSTIMRGKECDGPRSPC
jgi:hypothetical protein